MLDTLLEGDGYWMKLTTLMITLCLSLCKATECSDMTVHKDDHRKAVII